jgi:hypothetical protein
MNLLFVILEKKVNRNITEISDVSPHKINKPYIDISTFAQDMSIIVAFL